MHSILGQIPDDQLLTRSKLLFKANQKNMKIRNIQFVNLLSNIYYTSNMCCETTVKLKHQRILLRSNLFRKQKSYLIFFYLVAFSLFSLQTGSKFGLEYIP